MVNRINDFVRRVNVLCAKFRYLHTNARYALFKSYCMSLYGCQLWDLESKHMELFYVAWRKCVCRVLNVNVRTHCALLPLICDDLPINVQLNKRFSNFFTNIRISQNVLVKYCGHLAVAGSRSACCNNLNISKLYQTKKCTLNDVDETTLQTAGAIKDFIFLRDNTPDNANCIADILDCLCTK
jgi:hypothetical protein